MISIDTEYELDRENVVSKVTWSNDSNVCTATLNEDGDTYPYVSDLDGDETPVTSDYRWSLANCILSANVMLGLIPPHNFESTDCSNQH